MLNAAPPAIPVGKLPWTQKAFFKSFIKIPSAFIAEPFEIFLVALGLLDAVTLLLHRIMGSDKLFIAYYHGPVGLYIWSGVVISASVFLIWALSTMESKNLLAVRKLEITGLSMYAAAFAFYSYSNLSVGLNSGLPIIYPIINEIILTALVGSCLVRALSLASPITALSVTRVNRVKQIKAQLKEALKEDSRL